MKPPDEPTDRRNARPQRGVLRVDPNPSEPSISELDEPTANLSGRGLPLGYWANEADLAGEPVAPLLSRRSGRRNLIGLVIQDRYRIERLLGAGGMALVYEAVHLTLERKVAIKFLRQRFTHDAAAIERFKQEARLVSRIEHPNVVGVEDFGSLPDGTLYMVMELLRGASLDDMLDQGLLAPAFCLEIAIQACSGLAAAHEKNIVHRDVKPANLFLHSPGGDGLHGKTVVKVLDLGIAKVLGTDSSSNLNVTGSVFGTAQYMSPQQALGEAVDARTDIYSLGVVLYLMLTGRLPYSADSFMGILTQHLTHTPEWPKDIALTRGLPTGTEEVVMRALQKMPDKRYQTMREFMGELDLLLARLPSQPVVVGEDGQLHDTDRPPREKAPGKLTYVPLATASGNDGEIVELSPGTYWVGQRQGGQLECNTYLRVYRGHDTQVSVLIDPGPPRDLEAICAKVEAVLGGIERLDLIFLNHQDPDVGANSVALQKLNPRLHVVCSEDTWRLVQHLGLRRHTYSAVEHYPDWQTTLATGHRVKFIPTPYCHFRGAVMYYDVDTRVLFSGDLFGGLSSHPRLLGNESDWEGIDIFHELYMPTNRALTLAVDRVRQLTPSPRLIAPQHGRIFGEDQIPALLSHIAGLRVGIDLMGPGSEQERYLAAANHLITLLSPLVGQRVLEEELGRQADDGSFASLFHHDGVRITGIKIDPRVAMHCFIRGLTEVSSEEGRLEIESRVQQAEQRYGVSFRLAPEDNPDRQRPSSRRRGR